MKYKAVALGALITFALANVLLDVVFPILEAVLTVAARELLQ